MPKWVLRCAGCQSEFPHSQIEDQKFFDWHLPLRPQFPPGGAEIKCPNCGTSSEYLRTDLLYRA
jgi:DNA-directed RNA polymerase subunit RPC12/RpoP